MAAKKKRPGRPTNSISGGARKTRTYRADDREYRLIERAATKHGKTPAQWARETLLTTARRTLGG